MSLHHLASIWSSHPGSLSCLLYFLCMLAISIFLLFKLEEFLIYLYYYSSHYWHLNRHLTTSSWKMCFFLCGKQQMIISLFILHTHNSFTQMWVFCILLKWLRQQFGIPTDNSHPPNGECEFPSLLLTIDICFSLFNMNIAASSLQGKNQSECSVLYWCMS